MEKIADILDSIANEKNLPMEKVKEAFKEALINTAKKSLNDEDMQIEIVEDGKNFKIYQILEVVDEDSELPFDYDNKYIFIDSAREISPDIEVGDKLEYELKLEDFGVNGALILQKEFDFQILRLIERNLYEKYKAKIGEIISGPVVNITQDENTLIEIGELKGFLPKKNRIKGESFRVGDVLKAVIRYVHMDKRKGIRIELSRTSPKFLEGLLRIAVPEVKEGLVEIANIARIPGVRSKVAVFSNSPRIDAIGTIIGSQGVRINSVSNELNGEKIDVIEYSDKPEIFVARVLSPAIVKKVEIEGEKAKVYLDEDEKAKAIGKNGVNITLASMITKYYIELITEQSESERKESINTLENLFKI